MENPVPAAEQKLHDVIELWYDEASRTATPPQLEVVYNFHTGLADKYVGVDPFASAIHRGLAAVAAAHMTVALASQQIAEGGPDPFDP